MHINEDWFIPEIIDSETGEVLPAGEKGELVVTCLGKEALPLIRYRTGDITRLMYEPCKCGRTTVRMENISGRSDDMLVVRATNVFPSQIEAVLGQVPEIGPHYEIIVDVDGFKWMIQTTDFVEVGAVIGISIKPDEIQVMKKSEYSGLYGDYSSFSEEFDELSDPEATPEDEEEPAEA